MTATYFYHANCTDGFTAAWAAWRTDPTGTFTPVHYGQTLPEPSTRLVYFLDFCPPRETLDDLSARHSVCVLDHHLTAQAALRGWEGGTQVFDMERSGAGIAWDWFHDVNRRPPLITYVEDRDLWRFKLQYSREINAYIGSWPYDFSRWSSIDTWLRTAFRDCRKEGAAILRAEAKMTAMICDQSTRAYVGGHLVPVVNATSLWSEVGNELLRRFPDAPFVASYGDHNSGNRVWSLRSRKEDTFDVSAIASMYGGGGHRNAAGFRTKRPTIIDDGKVNT